MIPEKDLSLGTTRQVHSSIINVPGIDNWYIAHRRFAMPNGNGNNREITIEQMTVGADGLVRKVAPTLESVKPQTVPSPGSEVTAAVASRCVAGWWLCRF